MSRLRRAAMQRVAFVGPALPLFGGLERRNRTTAELLEQRSLVSLRRLQVTQLDVAKPADLLRDGGEADREVVIVRRELRQQFFEHHFVVTHQRPLGLELLAVTEDIERRAAQTFQLRQQAERGEDPRAERDLP